MNSYYDLSLSDQLRHQRKIHRKKCSQIDWGPCAFCKTLSQSAEEIERLTAELEHHKGKAEVWEDAARSAQTRIEELENELQNLQTRTD